MRTITRAVLAALLAGGPIVSAPADASADQAVPEPTPVWADPFLLPAGSPPSTKQGSGAGSAAPSSVPAGASRYVSLVPERILDTRRGLGAPQSLSPDQTIRLQVVGASQVPATATAVVLNLTVTQAQGWGYVTSFPAGQARPDASSINFERSGQTIANLVTVSLGAGGAVDLYASNGVQLIADVEGYYEPSGAAAAGRFVPMGPVRIVDTRSGAPIAGGSVTDYDIAGLAGLPAGIDSAVLKVTVTQATDAGYWTIYPSGSAQPDVSNLNLDRAGQTIANQAVVHLTNGHAAVYAERGGHLILDIVGYYTSGTWPVDSTGLFVPTAPYRLLDTRLGWARPGPRRTVTVPVAGRAGLPATGIAAVAVNATATEANPGYLTTWSARQYRPNASSLNMTDPGQTIAGHVITPVSTDGFDVFTVGGTQLVVDLAGWFTGTPGAVQLPIDVPLPPASGPEGSGGFGYLAAIGPNGVQYGVTDPGPELSPIRWNPCSTIRVALNLGPYGAYASDVREAMDRFSSATGLNLVEVGTSTFTPSWASPFEHSTALAGSPAVPYDLLITLGGEDTTDLLDDNVIGRAVSLPGGSPVHFVAGTLVIDVPDLTGRPVWSGVGLGSVVLHELGHIGGLDHYNDPGLLMNPYTSGVPMYAPGDLRGLWQVGSVRGCI